VQIDEIVKPIKCLHRTQALAYVALALSQ